MMPEWMYADGVSLTDPFDPERIVLAYVRQHRADEPEPERLARDVWDAARRVPLVPTDHPEFWPIVERTLASVLADVEERRATPDRSARAAADVSNVVVAKYPGWCARCEEPISPGDTIRATVGAQAPWEHADCDEARAARPTRAVACAACGEPRPCECDDLCPVWTI